MSLPINRAADVLLGGGIIAYPTEGVFGLGCMPDNPQALTRLIEIKQRDPAKGLILVAEGFVGFGVHLAGPRCLECLVREIYQINLPAEQATSESDHTRIVC